MANAQLSEPEVYAEIRDLVAANRARCLWFAAEDYQPKTDNERLTALSYIERHGDRNAFIRARELSQWLLRRSSAN